MRFSRCSGWRSVLQDANCPDFRLCPRNLRYHRWNHYQQYGSVPQVRSSCIFVLFVYSFQQVEGGMTIWLLTISQQVFDRSVNRLIEVFIRLHLVINPSYPVWTDQIAVLSVLGIVGIVGLVAELAAGAGAAGVAGVGFAGLFSLYEVLARAVCPSFLHITVFRTSNQYE